MTDAQALEEIAAQFCIKLDGTVGRWFGKPCIEVGDKVFVALLGRILSERIGSSK